MNIVLYKGQFQYDVVNYFVDDLKKSFIEMGHAVTILDLRFISSDALISFFKNNHINLVLSFNGINAINKDLYEKLNIPLGIILVDHPFYHLSRIETFKGKTTFFCMLDLEHLDCFEECIDKDIPITWLPHGGTEIQFNEHIDKEYDVIFAGSINDYTYFEDILLNLKEGIVKKIALNLYDKGKENYNLSLYGYLKEELKDSGIEVKDLMNDKNYLNAFSYIYILVDKALRARNRYRIMKRLLDEGIKVQYYGNLQTNEFKKYKNFLSHGPLDYMNLINEIKKAKLLIHEIPFFQNGSHERFLTSMLNKTLVLSNINNYCNNQYIDKESIVFYDMNNLDTLVERVYYYLENENERMNIEKKAYEITKHFNTWRNRAEEIIDIYNNFIELSR